MSSLRWRLALAIALVAALVAAVLLISVYEVSASQRLDQSRSVELRRARLAAEVYASTGRLVLGAVPDGPGPPAPLRAAVLRGALASYVEGDEVWAGVRVDGPARAVFVRDSIASDRRALSRLRRELLAIGLVTVLAAAALGFALATRLSSRLRAAAASARRIEAGETGTRIDARGSDEVAALGAAIDGMADSLEAQVERERRFAADVAHELRTPVTGLVTAASLLPESEAAAMVQGRAAALRALIEDLLEISRLESGVETAELRTIDLADLAREVARDRPDVSVEAAAPAPATTDPRRLARVLANLLDNAERHGAPPVTVRVTGGQIDVLDAGAGFSESMLGRATERFATGDEARERGTGLGLAIAAGQLHLLGGTLEIANGPAGGAAVTVLLPSGEAAVTDRA